MGCRAVALTWSALVSPLRTRPPRRKAAEQPGFRKAIEEPHLTQPAISLQVKALEEELGADLFDRRGHRIRLTRAGEVFAGIPLSSTCACRERPSTSTLRHSRSDRWLQDDGAILQEHTFARQSYLET